MRPELSALSLAYMMTVLALPGSQSKITELAPARSEYFGLGSLSGTPSGDLAAKANRF
jgi:hypothetical protein